MKKPCGDVPVLQNSQLRQYPHLDDVEIVEASSEIIDVLLGVDSGDVLTPSDRVLGPSGKEPLAARGPLGWYVQGGHGLHDVSTCNTCTTVNFNKIAAVSELEEFLGIENSVLKPKNCVCAQERENRQATEKMQRSLKLSEDGVYEITLPWKKPPILPNNYDYALKRFISLEKQYKNKPKEWELYCKQISDQWNRKVARKVSQAEFENDLKTGKRMWFLPHFAVLKDSNSTPVRVVYDAKARYNGHCLNDYLAKGDNLNLNIFEIGLRFREYEVGVVADISKMFQAIKLTPDDARFHRYLFRDSPDKPIEVFELQTVTFGDKPSPTAAIIALRHVAQEHAPDNPEIQRVVSNQFYVDDLNDSQRSVDSVKFLKSDLTATLAKGNFNIRKWLSNVPEICDAEFAPSDGNATVLGTRWNLKKDTLSVKPVQFQDYMPTKRNILKKTASYYDVFGILSGIIVRPKMLLQKLWQFDLDWDTPISPDSELCKTLKVIERDLKDVAEIEINRCLIPEKYRGQPLPNVSLHGLSDASEDGMGMGVWLRFEDPQTLAGDLSFVCARARLTPMKQSSIPRKELQALLLLCRLAITIRDALRLDIQYMKMWTDSMTVIRWLRGQSKAFRSYVAYRIGEITTEFDPDDIAYVPTELNVIDLVSRGCTVDEMQKVIDGPVYLRQPPAQWPKTPDDIRMDNDDAELKKFHVRNAKVLALKLQPESPEQPIMNPADFSSWTRLTMVTARILSLKDLPKNQLMNQFLTKIAEFPSLRKIKEAEMYWVRHAQKDLNFADHNIRKLNPVFDEKHHVYRVGGRIDKAPVSYDMRHPYLLPRKNPVSLLVAREKHRHAVHGGQIRTVTEIRRSYWIIGDMKLARRVIKECKLCIRNNAEAIKTLMADLPLCRVKPFTPAFYTTFVDYLGPINVKLNRNTVSRGYCAVFTCSVVRAVHLTCVQDLTTDAFLMALDRFVAIRGAPANMRSDNATCFRGADNTIKELNLVLDQEKIKAASVRFKIDWKFGPPDGPHHQGAVERMVQEVKKSMKHLVQAGKLTFIEWETVFSQISALINSRPITAVTSSPLDEPPITPNHFLIGRSDLPSPQVPCEPYVGNLHKRRAVCHALVETFWQRWMVNIHKLSPRHKWAEARENVKNGDIVLIIDEKEKRANWKMAEIIQVYPGDDDIVRVVDVKLSGGQVLKRPVTKLVLLMKRGERTDVDVENE